MKETTPVLCTARRKTEQRLEQEFWERDFTENVCCARAIERAIRKSTESDTALTAAFIHPVLAEFGTKRTLYILAHTLKSLAPDAGIRTDLKTWSSSIRTIRDGIYGRYYAVNAELPSLEAFIDLVMDMDRDKDPFEHDRFHYISI